MKSLSIDQIFKRPAKGNPTNGPRLPLSPCQLYTISADTTLAASDLNSWHHSDDGGREIHLKSNEAGDNHFKGKLPKAVVV